MNRRHWVLGIALCTTLGAVWWASSLEEDDAVTPKRDRKASSEHFTKANSAAAPRKSASSQAQMLALLGSSSDETHEHLPKLKQDPFAPTSFDPPPPPPPPQPKPSAPPLPFKYKGRLNDGNRLAIFLDDGTKILIAHKGDTLYGQYSVLDITENSALMEFIPLATKQILSYEQ